MEDLKVDTSSELNKTTSLQRDLAVARQTFNDYKFSWLSYVLSSIGGACVILLFLIIMGAYNPYGLKEFYKFSTISFIIASLIYIGNFNSKRKELLSNVKRIEYELIESGTAELKDTINEDFFTKLVQINFKYIDRYYFQTQEQADKSFRLSAIAAIVGFIIIIAGISMMYWNSERTEPAYVTTAAGILSEFIAAVFFYLYNQTILKMSEYHQKLVITQNISLALKITEDLQPEAKAKALELLIDRLTTDANKYLTGNLK